MLGVRFFSHVVKTKPAFGINLINQGNAGFIERFGKKNRLAKVGFNFTIPVIESVKKINMKEIAYPIDPQSSVTKDNVQVKTSGAIYFKVIDPDKVCYEVDNLIQALEAHAQSAMRTAVGKIDLDTLFHNRNSLNNEVLQSMQNAAERWGVEIIRYEIAEVVPDKQVSAAMDSQSIAERKRRETLLNADAQRQHDISISEGKYQAIVNEAKANKEQQIMQAEASGEQVRIQSEAEAESIKRIGEALRANPETAQYLLAQKYLKSISEMLPKSAVFVPKDITNIPQTVAVATSVYDHLKQN